MEDDGAGSGLPNLAKRGQDKEWERKERLREYRVAARREKRNRKADEKKQRKLNAIILRRMTRNPDKYNKNIERNRSREIESERRKIWNEAVQQARRLAAVYDPTGSAFNVGPVVTQANGTVISVETLKKREEQELAKLAREDGTISATGDPAGKTSESSTALRDPLSSLHNGINPARLALMDVGRIEDPGKKMSKTQQKKRAALEPRPPPPKPTIPDGVSVPDGETNWLALWDLSDDQVERRVIREKKRKAAERKALRTKQKSGKVERRAARDEKRKVYRELKLTWKAIKEEETRLKTRLISAEQEEAKRIAVQINSAERKAAMDCCARLGFTFGNTPGVADIKPKALGMKGMEVDFDSLEMGETPSDLKKKTKGRRVDLGVVPEDAKVHVLPTGQSGSSESPGGFIKLDVGNGQDFRTLDYNHKLRRKLRRAIENAEIQKEMLVRQRTLEYFIKRKTEPPIELQAPPKPVNIRGQRILEDGTLETAKQERVRMRMELAEFNKAAKVLRAQAKRRAMEAGLRVHAELTGKLPTTSKPEHGVSHHEPEEFPTVEGLSAPGILSSAAAGQRLVEACGAPCDLSNGRRAPENHADRLCDADKPVLRNEKKRKFSQGPTAENRDIEMLDGVPALKVTAMKGRTEALAPSPCIPQRSKESSSSEDQDNISRWNVQSLSGDGARREKFLRLLGASSSGKATTHPTMTIGAQKADDILKVNVELEKQYEAGMRIKHEGKKKGLGN